MSTAIHTARGQCPSQWWQVELPPGLLRRDQPAAAVARSRSGTSQPNSNAPNVAPAACATMKPPTSTGRIPAYVLLNARAIVIAGFANDVDAVNQYAATM